MCPAGAGVGRPRSTEGRAFRAPRTFAFDLVVLEDDRLLQPAENVVPIVRTDALDRWGPDLASSLDRFSARLTTIELRFLVARVDAGEPVDRVAAEWLAEQGLVEPD